MAKSENNGESIADFYRVKLDWLPEKLDRAIGQFNIFKHEEFVEKYSKEIPYNRKDFFKVCFIVGQSKVHYADKTIEITDQALFFGNPHVPYNWEYIAERHSGYFIIFTETFFEAFGNIKDYPVFKASGNPLYFLTTQQGRLVKSIYTRILKEAGSTYLFKEDVIRNLIYELIHLAQKMSPISPVENPQNASTRVMTLFADLMESQYPISTNSEVIQLRSPADFADKLAIHVNYLNRAVKAVSGRTTTGIIGERMIREARRLLLNTNWSIGDIAYVFGFQESPHFINFFKKSMGMSPSAFRKSQV